MNNLDIPCRSCGKSELTMIMSLGRTPLANALLTKAQLHTPEEYFPLELAFCHNCKMLQITETVSPEKLFRDYFYFSSVSDSAVENARLIAKRMTKDRKLNENSLVVEIASNDGYLLKHYVEDGIPVLGVEPAENIANVANDQGIKTLPEFFSNEFAAKLRAEYPAGADVMHANNVLAHVADLNGVVAGIGHLLNDTGVAVIEAPYGKILIDNVEFDTIYHEHLCYFTVTSLNNLFNRHNLTIQDIEMLPIHGGSLRVFVGHEKVQAEAVRVLLAEEETWGVNSPDVYLNLENRVTTLKKDLVALLTDLKKQGKRIVAYGASAKGATLLNYYQINNNLLDYIVDRSTVKQGHYAPGSHLEILSPAKLLEDRPDYALLLTWNFWEEIVSQQEEYRNQGGKFIIPIPRLRII